MNKRGFTPHHMKPRSLKRGWKGALKASFPTKPRASARDAGFTLIEVLVGLVILAIGLLAIAGMQITSVKGNFFSSNLTQASVLAQDRLELLRSFAWGHDDLTGGTHNEGTITRDFTREYTVAVIPGTTMLDITVTVRWRDDTDHSVSFSTVRSE